MSDKTPSRAQVRRATRIAQLYSTLGSTACASRRALILLACAALLVVGYSLRLAVRAAVPVFVVTLRSVHALGAWGVPLLFACEAAAFLLLLPISPLHIGVGFLYGPLRGTLLAWAAYAIGCVPPFLLARVPMLAERFLQMRRRMEVLDGVFGAVELEPFKLIVCLRLSPLLPSTLNSYDSARARPTRACTACMGTHGWASGGPMRVHRMRAGTCSGSPTCRCAPTWARRWWARCPTSARASTSGRGRTHQHAYTCPCTRAFSCAWHAHCVHTGTSTWGRCSTPSPTSPPAACSSRRSRSRCS